MDTFPTDLLPPWEGRVMLAGRRGSRAWGTAGSNSDSDWFAVWAHPVEFYLGLATVPEGRRERREETWSAKSGERDLAVYDVRKFVQFLYRNLPEFHKDCWIHPSHRTHMTVGGRMIHDNRHKMLSAQLVRAFWHTGEHMAESGKYGRAIDLLSGATQLAHEGGLHKRCTKIRRAITREKNGAGLQAEEMYGKLLKAGYPLCCPDCMPDEKPTWAFYNRLTQEALRAEWGRGDQV